MEEYRTETIGISRKKKITVAAVATFALIFCIALAGAALRLF